MTVSAQVRRDTCGTIRYPLLPLVDATIEYAFSLLGRTLTTCRLFPITLHHVTIRTFENPTRDLMVRTLILLRRHATQAVEMW
jgi:hypothetical protein